MVRLEHLSFCKIHLRTKTLVIFSKNHMTTQNKAYGYPFNCPTKLSLSRTYFTTTPCRGFASTLDLCGLIAARIMYVTSALRACCNSFPSACLSYFKLHFSELRGGGCMHATVSISGSLAIFSRLHFQSAGSLLNCLLVIVDNRCSVVVAQCFQFFACDCFWSKNNHRQGLL